MPDPTAAHPPHAMHAKRGATNAWQTLSTRVSLACRATAALVLAFCASTGQAAQAATADTPSPAARTYTYGELAHQLIDLEALATLPPKGERTATFSSYDRASRHDASLDSYVQWSANDDGHGFVRLDADGGRVLAEMRGPGVIRRIASASHSQAHVRIYVDDAPTPVVDLPWDDYFSGQRAPFNHPSLAYEVAGGLNNFVPIPYQRSVKVVADPAFHSYHYVEYTSFPEGTVVPSFTGQLSGDDLAALTQADEFLRNGLGTDPAGPRPGDAVTRVSKSVAPGRALTLLDTTGAGAVTTLQVKVKGLQDQAAQWAALRELSIRMHWDGDSAPAVWAPLGDFFGTTAGVRPYLSLPLGVKDDGTMYSHWYMPFGQGARIEIRNDGAVPREIVAKVVTAPLAQAADRLARFHAKWNRNVRQPVRADRWPDYAVLKTKGRGRFLGLTMQVYKPNNDADPNAGPGGYWWGEGDEKFFVDGEAMPSWFGTGSEDYFGYAWATPDRFAKPFHTQLFNQGSIHWKGNRSLSRFQIADAVPFHRSFEASIEKYYGDDFARYAVTPYWYLDTSGSDSYKPVPLAERTGFYQAPMPGDPTRIEGEEMELVSKTHGSLTPQFMDWAGPGLWSHDLHLFWYHNNLSHPGAGSQAVLKLQVPATGPFTLVGVLTRANDYGIVRFDLDGSACTGDIDLFSGTLGTTGEIDLCSRNLSAGAHELRITVVGKNSASRDFYSAIDYLRLRPTR